MGGSSSRFTSRVVVGLIAGLVGLVSPASAQWKLGFDLGQGRYFGSSRDRSGSPDSVSLSPHLPTTIGIRAERSVGRQFLGLSLMYEQPGLGADMRGYAIIFTRDLRALELTPYGSFRFGSAGSTGDLRLQAGVAADAWGVTGYDPRVRLGPMLGLAWEWKVSSHVAGVLRGEGVVTKSLFDDGDLPSQLVLIPTWRLGMTIGLRYVSRPQ